MKIFLSLWLLLIHGVVAAQWVDFPIPDLVAAADIGVVAKPTNIHRYYDGKTGTAKGTLVVEKWLFGDIPHTKLLAVEWDFNPLVVGTGDIFDESTHIWLLQRRGGRLVRPIFQSVVDASTETAVLEASRNPLGARQMRDDGITTYILRLTYRNLTTGTLKLPVPEIAANSLVLPSAMHLSVTRFADYGVTDTEPISQIAGRVTYTSTPKYCELRPGQSRILDIPIAEFYELAKDEDCFVRWGIEGWHDSNLAYIIPPKYLESDVITYGDEDYTNRFVRGIFIFIHSPGRELLAYLLTFRGFGTVLLLVCESVVGT